MDRGTWWATVHESQRVGHDWMTNAHTHTLKCSLALESWCVFFFCLFCFFFFLLRGVFLVVLRVSLVVVRKFLLFWCMGFSSCGTWFSCSMARGILVLWSGNKPESPMLEGGWLTTRPPGKSQNHGFKRHLRTIYVNSPFVGKESEIHRSWLCPKPHGERGRTTMS